MNAALPFPVQLLQPPMHWESRKKRCPNDVSHSQNEFHPFMKLKFGKKLCLTVFQLGQVTGTLG